MIYLDYVTIQIFHFGFEFLFTGIMTISLNGLETHKKLNYVLICMVLDKLMHMKWPSV